MYDFSKEHFSERIEKVSTQPRFQIAKIRIEDSSLTEKEYDLETGKWAITGDPVIYQGQARLIAIGAGRFDRGENQANTTTITTLRIQIPNASSAAGYGDGVYGEGQYTGGLIGRVKRGCKVFVMESPRNPSLETMIFSITSDLQGSSAASRTFEAASDADVKVP